jgi:hypothetical protein
MEIKKNFGELNEGSDIFSRPAFAWYGSIKQDTKLIVKWGYEKVW